MHLFDQDISLIRKAALVFKGNVSSNWSVNGTPNGGYLMAMLTNAMVKCSDKKETPIITANYISRSVPGEADIFVEKFAQSTQFTRLQARLVQGGMERIRIIGTFADEKNECFMKRYEASPPDMHSPEECIEIPSVPDLTILDNMEIRLDPECAGWMSGSLSKRSELKGWIRHRKKRKFDLFSILSCTDSFPPPIMASQGMLSWVPTIELSINVRNIPETTWLKCIFRTRFINCGLLEEDGEVWDENGRLVSISRQIAQFRTTGA
ncbi:MAG: thioesterase family protein [Desulfobacterales bacterium]